MIILAYDTETTGLPSWKEPSESDNQPHLVQLAALVADTDTRQVIASIDLIVKPDGWTIPDEVAEIHGITTEYALEHGVPESEVYRTFMSLWNGRHRIAHNRTFDQRILRIAGHRFGTEAELEAWAEKDNHDCTMIMSRPICQIPNVGKAGIKAPNLAEAYKHFTGKDLVNAHTAMADTKACLDVYFGLLDMEGAA